MVSFGISEEAWRFALGRPPGQPGGLAPESWTALETASRLTHERPYFHHTYEVVDCEPHVAQDIADWFQKSAEVLAVSVKQDDQRLSESCARTAHQIRTALRSG